MQVTTTVSHPTAPLESDERALADVFSAYVGFAVLWLLFATFIGVVLSYKFTHPDFLSGAGWLTFGRLRPIHTNDTFYGWASIGIVGLAYYVAAR